VGCRDTQNIESKDFAYAHFSEITTDFTRKGSIKSHKSLPAVGAKKKWAIRQYL